MPKTAIAACFKCTKHPTRKQEGDSHSVLLNRDVDSMWDIFRNDLICIQTPPCDFFTDFLEWAATRLHLPLAAKKLATVSACSLRTCISGAMKMCPVASFIARLLGLLYLSFTGKLVTLVKSIKRNLVSLDRFLPQAALLFVIGWCARSLRSTPDLAAAEGSALPQVL